MLYFMPFIFQKNQELMLLGSPSFTLYLLNPESTFRKNMIQGSGSDVQKKIPLSNETGPEK